MEPYIPPPMPPNLVEERLAKLLIKTDIVTYTNENPNFPH